jgi:transmembrane sensor
VTLDTATRIDVEIQRSRRSARLSYGRARFQVVQANTPFVVETASATVTTQHGVIDVEQLGREGQVRVLSGAADVLGPSGSRAAPVALGAGEGAALEFGNAAPKAAAAPAADWTRGMLQFDGTPLAQAVALANRYSERHVVLAGDLGALRVTGAFRAGDTTGLARALAAAFGLSLKEDPGGDLILSPGATAKDRNNKRGG